MPALIVALVRDRRDCSCDRRFLDVAHDIDCPTHGLLAVTEAGAGGMGTHGARRRQQLPQADAA